MAIAQISRAGKSEGIRYFLGTVEIGENADSDELGVEASARLPEAGKALVEIFLVELWVENVVWLHGKGVRAVDVEASADLEDLDCLAAVLHAHLRDVFADGSQSRPNRRR